MLNYTTRQEITVPNAQIGSGYTVPDKSLVAWVQIDLKCPSNIFLINIVIQEMACFNPNSFWNNNDNETFTAW